MFKPAAKARMLFLAVFGLLLSFQAAEARVFRVSYTGIVGSGVDYAGLYGSPGSSLVGKTWAAVFTWNTDHLVFVDDAAPRYAIGAGTQFGTTGGIEAAIRIGTRTRSVDFDFYALHSSNVGYLDEFIVGRPRPGEDFSATYFMGSALTPSATGSYYGPWSDDDLGFPDGEGGTAHPEYFFGINNVAPGDRELDAMFYGRTVSVMPVPEPKTWALLLLGFACAGSATRIARRSISRG